MNYSNKISVCSNIAAAVFGVGVLPQSPKAQMLLNLTCLKEFLSIST
jgi:hypothetical protein